VTFDFTTLADGFYRIGREIEAAAIRAGVRAASNEVRRILRPGEVQPTVELCLLAHGICCPRGCGVES